MHGILTGMARAQAAPSNIPPTVATNFTYGFLPSEAASAFAPPAGSGQGAVGDVTSFVGNIKDSFGAAASTIGAPAVCLRARMPVPVHARVCACVRALCSCLRVSASAHVRVCVRACEGLCH